MSIALQGTTKAGAISGASASVTFDSIPSDGDLIVLQVGNGSIPVTPTGFNKDVAADGSQNNEIYSRIAHSEGSATYTITGLSGVGVDVYGTVFRATNGFRTRPECTVAYTATSASAPLSSLLLPSNASAVMVSTARTGSTSSSITVTWNGGSPSAPDLGATPARCFGDYKILTSIPSTISAVWALSGSAVVAAGLAVYSENFTVATDPSRANTGLQYFKRGKVEPYVNGKYATTDLGTFKRGRPFQAALSGSSVSATVNASVVNATTAVNAPTVTRSASPFNLLANPGAETGDTSFWSAAGGPGGITNAGASLAVISSDHNSGADCFQLTIPSTPSQWRGMWQQVDGLAANTQYTYTVFVKQGTFASSYIIAIRDQTNTIEVDSSSLALTGGWVQHTIGLTTGATGNVSIVVTVEADQNTTAGGTILVDDAVLSRNDSVVQAVTTVPSPVVTTSTNATVNPSAVNAATTISAPSPIADANVGQLAGNGTAETTVTSPWRVDGGPGGITNAGATVAITASDSHSGADSFLVSIPGTSSQWRGIWQQIDGLAANTKYTYQVWVKQGTYASSYIVAVSDITNGIEVDSSSFALTGGWVQRTVSVTTGATGPVSIVITVEANLNGQTAGTFLVDDAALSKADQFVLATTAVNAPAITASATVTPSAVNAVTSIATPTFITNQIISVSVVNAVTTVPPPSLSQNVFPGAVNATTAVNAPTITASATVSPGAVNAVTSVGVPSINDSANATPGSVNAATSIATPTFIIGQSVTPGSVNAVIAVNAPQITASTNVTPAAVNVVITVNSITFVAPASPAPSAVAAATTINAPTITATANAPPAAVLVPIAVGAPTITASATVTPDAVASSVAIPSPSLSQNVYPATVVGGNGQSYHIYTTGSPTGGFYALFMELVTRTGNTALAFGPDVGRTTLAQIRAIVDVVYGAGNTIVAGTDWNDWTLTFTGALIAESYFVATDFDVLSGGTSPAPHVDLVSNPTAGIIIPTPVITATASVSVTDVDAATAIPTPTVLTDQTVSATDVDASTSIPAPAVECGADVTPNAVQASTSIPSPSLSQSVHPAAVQVTGTVPDATVVFGTFIHADPVDASATVPSPAPSTSVTITPGTVNAATSIGAPQVTAFTSVAPNAVNAATSINAPVITAAAQINASAVDATTAIGAPSITAASNATPAAVAVVSTVPAPAITASATVAQAAVACTATVPSPQVTASVSVTPAAVGVACSVATPTITASADVAPAAVDVATSAGGSVVIPALPAAVDVAVSIPVPTIVQNVTITAVAVDVVTRMGHSGFFQELVDPLFAVLANDGSNEIEIGASENEVGLVNSGSNEVDVQESANDLVLIETGVRSFELVDAGANTAEIS